MKFKEGAQVRLRNDVTADMLASESVPIYMLGDTLTVTMCGRTREGGRRYKVAVPNERDWWLPGSFLKRAGCMFNKEV